MSLEVIPEVTVADEGRITGYEVAFHDVLKGKACQQDVGPRCRGYLPRFGATLWFPLHDFQTLGHLAP